MALELTLPGTGASEAQSYDIMADRDAVVAKLAGSDEIDALTSTIDVNDLNTIVTFGSRAAEQISKASDEVLKSMRMGELDDSGRLMQTLAGLMSRFDFDELQDNPSLWGKLFGSPRKGLDRILDKYRTMGDEVDKIYIQLRQYEEEIKKSNRQLEALFQANVEYFHELEKYIVAGEQGCREIEDYMNTLKAEQQKTGDPALTFEIQTLSTALNMLEARTHDLRTAELVALQSIPMIKLVQFNNMNLVQKINAAFIVTLPVFKQALAQAILMKRQRIQAEGLSALDARTNELVKKNARAASEQARLSARLSGDGGRSDALKSAWRTIVDGIDETRKLQSDAQASRERDQARLEALRREFAASTGGQI